MTAATPIRCAIYTRKSSEEGLEQDFNSLDAQREACAAYIASQRSEGWILSEHQYDDGGLSGETLDRPALQRLFDDIDQGRIDRVVVYKIDRLTRSLLDFAKLIERFEAAGASFVAVTQHFNTSTSMGRLTLNVLLSFAQFEREVTAERIRDKIAASKRKGMWMGGVPPLGYDVRNRALVIDQREAETVRKIFQSYLDLGSVRAVKEAVDQLGLRSKHRVSAGGRARGGKRLSRGALYKILSNPVYIGGIRHRDIVHEGRHAAIVDQPIWQAVQGQLADQAAKRGRRADAAERSPLAGRIFDETGIRLTPSHALKGSRRYRYYISRRLTTERAGNDLAAWRLPAREVERAVADAALAIIDNLPAPVRLPDQVKASQAKHALATGEIEVICDLVRRVDISTDAIGIALDGERVKCLLPEVTFSAPDLARSVPFQIRRKGVEAKLITHVSRRAPDESIVALLVKSHRFWRDIKAGQALSTIARREGVTPTWIRQVALFAFLAPDIVEACLAGNQPPELSAKALLTTPLALAWPEQRRQLGFEG